MSNIFDALKVLKAEIVRINGVPMSQNSDGLEDRSLSTLRHHNADLWPEDLIVPAESQANVATAEQTADYSNNVLQAMWNITDYSSGVASGIYYRNEISTCALFMGDKYVPKVIDDKTYQAAKALVAFFSVALGADALGLVGKFMTTSMLQSIHYTVEHAQTRLKERIAIYEANLPDQLAEGKAVLESVNEQKKRIQAETILFVERIKQIDDTIKSYIKDTPLDQNVITQRLAELTILEQQFLDKVTEYSVFLNQWDSQNNADAQYKKNVSVFVRELNKDLTQPSNLSKAHNVWIELFNQPSSQAFINPHRILSDAHSEGRKNLERYLIPEHMNAEGKENRILNRIQNLRGDLENKLLLAKVKQDMHSYLDNISPTIQNALPVKPTNSIDLSESLKQQQSYLSDLLNGLSVLKEQDKLFDQRFPANSEINGYQQLITKAKEPLCILEQQLNDRIEHATRLIQQLKDDIAKSTAKGRSMALDNLTQEISLAFTTLCKHDKERTASAFSLDRFDQTPEAKAVNKRINKNKDLTVKLDNVVKQIDARKEFLGAARQELLYFQKVLTDHSGLYIPVDQIHKRHLKDYLEVNADYLEAYINALYAQEQAARGWSGFNLTNLSAQFSRFSAEMTGDSDTNLDLLKNLITQKLELIESELASKPSDEIAANQDLLTETNLWLLQQDTTGMLREMEANQVVIDEWLPKREVVAQEYYSADRAHKLSALHHKLLQVTKYGYQYEFKLDDVAHSQKQLNHVMENLHDNDPQTALDYLNQNEALIKKTNLVDLMQKKANPHDVEGDRLNQLIQNGLYELTSWMNDLKNHSAKSVLVTPELTAELDGIHQKIEALSHKHKSLTEQRSGLTGTYTLQADLIAKEKIRLSEALKQQKEAEAERQRQAEAAAQEPPPPDSFPELPLDEPQASPEEKSLADYITVFDMYLEERAQTYRLPDFFRSLAAFTLGCFGYKSPQQERENYINKELKPALQAFLEDENTAENLLLMIEDGQKRFAPRAALGKQGYEHSLSGKLEQLKHELDLENKVQSQAGIGYSQ